MAGLSEIATAITLVWRQGISWTARRAWIELARISGLLERRFPCASWDAFPEQEPVVLDLPVRRDPDALAAALRATLGGAATTMLVATAERVLEGEWPFFGANWIRTGFPPTWHRDPFSGWEPSAAQHWTRIPLRSGPGDIKGVWEPSRFTPAYLLARAALVSSDNRYAAGFWSLVESWAQANPPGCGANWACGQEATFRTIALLSASAALERFPATSDARRRLLSRLLFAHGRRIWSNLAYARAQKNNHGVSEGVGLYTLGLLFRGQPEADRWRRRGLRVIREELARQVYPDGGYVQHSTNYARVALHDILWALAVCRACDAAEKDLDPALDAARRVATLLRAMQDPVSGEVPPIGADDGTMVLDLTSCRRRDFRPVLQATAIATEGVRWYPPGPWDEEAVWLHGPAALEAPYRPLAPEVARDAGVGGYYVRRSGALHTVLRAPVFHDRPSHADLLHLDVWWSGVNVALDAGTYSYHAPPPWHGAFATGAFHNGVTVDNAEPMRRGPGFTWLDWTSAPISAAWSAVAPVHAQYLEASHDGYARLGEGMVVRRGVLVLAGDCVVVVDVVVGLGRHRARLRWLLCAAPLRREPDGVVLDLPAGSFRVRILGQTSDGREAVVAAVSDAPPPDAHRAASYRSLEPAVALTATLDGELPARLVTVFAAGEQTFSWHDGKLRCGDVTVRLSSATSAGPLIDRAIVCASS
ncbi:MAG: heparinase II/III family protein [Gemmatimonadales bacterium]